ncbi:MAG: tetratricopeptide repeat protein [Phycisphaerales bacterium]|nr:tetratricopeptide repeat protein [Phycisphaerales bacterium]
MTSFSPDSAHLQRAMLLFGQQRLDLAEPELRRALGDDPQNSTAHAMLALCLARRKKPDEALNEARLAVGAAPDDSYPHYVLACVLDDLHEFDEAEASIRQSIALDPHDPDARALLASLHFQRHRWKDALAAAEEALEQDPEHVAANNLRAMSLIKLGRKAEAGQTIDSALARDPDNAVTHANMGWTLLHQNDSRAAIDSFREALRLHPGLEWARVGLVTALKARNPVYAVFLRYVLWMQKLSPKVRTAVIIGLYILYRILAEIRRNQPQYAPYILPLLILYAAFVLISWLADPLFNLLLRLHPLGRHALTASERRSGEALAVCLLIAAACVGAWYATRNDDYFIAAMAFGVLALPTTSALAAGPGSQRIVMATCAGLAAALAIPGVVLIAAGLKLGGVLCALAIFIAVISSWLSIPAGLARR